MSNNLDFKSMYFDGIYTPYRFPIVNTNFVIDEIGYNHKFDMAREEDQNKNSILDNLETIENSNNVISSSNNNSYLYPKTYVSGTNNNINTPSNQAQSNSSVTVKINSNNTTTNTKATDFQNMLTQLKQRATVLSKKIQF